MVIESNRKILVFSIIMLFVISSFFPVFSGEQINKNLQKKNFNQETSPLTFYTFDKTGSKQKDVNLSKEIAEEISNKLEMLKYQTINHPLSDETRFLKQDFIETLDTYGLIPSGMTKEHVLSLLNPKWQDMLNNRPNPKFKEALSQIIKPFFNNPSFKNSDALYSDWNVLCNIGSAGFGIPFPLFMLPRPRGFALWISSFGTTYTSSLISTKNFVAAGAQQGLAAGFVGVGLTGSFYGMTGYIFLGYAVYTIVHAEVIEHFTPPNQKPEITVINPADGAVDVPLSLSELSFRISDYERDSMDYTVSTNPYIGSGSGNNKKDGIYKIPLSGLVGNTKYTWHIVVSDDYSSVEKDFSFTTEAVAPIVTNPSPNDDMWVPVDTSQFSFKLKDKQGDLMDYTVETSPNIGSSSGFNVGEGTYYLDVSGLDYTTEYTWYVNATDGTFWTREIFNFKTQPIMVFDPFDEGWQYRKKITINHNKVEDDLIDFPLLINKFDSDLKLKAQSNGDDILFMDGQGVANRLMHEIELFDSSNGELVAWVNIPYINDNINTVLYMYYGNPDCSSQEYPELVWDSNFVLVQHFEESSGVIYDSTVYNNDGIPNGDITYNTDGKINGALGFDGSGDSVVIKDDTSLDFGTGDFSAIVWTKTLAYNGDGQIINKRDYWGSNIGLQYHESQFIVWLGDYPPYSQLLYNGVDADEWYHVAITRENGIVNLFVNGEIIESKEVSGSISTNADLYLGIDPYHSEENFFGFIDEIRFSNIMRSAEYFRTEYNNHNDPTSFTSFAPEESEP